MLVSKCTIIIYYIYQDGQVSLQVNIYNQSYRKKVRLSIKNYSEIDVDIYEIGQDIWVVDQA